MQHLWSTWKTTQAFPFYALPEVNQGRDGAWPCLLPQGLLALVWLRSWSLVVVSGGDPDLVGPQVEATKPTSAFLADCSPTLSPDPSLPAPLMTP